MKKYRAIVWIMASVEIKGIIEASTKEEAIDIALSKYDQPCLCTYCKHEVEFCDPVNVCVEEVDTHKWGK